MSLIQNRIPEAVCNLSGEVHWEAPDDLVQRWMAFSGSRDDSGSDTLDIFDIIGEDWFGEGVTDTTVANHLKGRSGKDVKVRINSPGGDVFAGLSIYNLLRAHNGKVTVEVTGIAASAASVIAMAADEIVMGEGSMIMIHNAWGMAIGNQHDMRDTSEVLAKIDNQLIGIYAARTGLGEDEIGDMMAAETFLTHDEAVEAKFADRVDAAMKVSAKASKTDTNPVKEKRRLERALGRIGVPRAKRPEIISLILEDGALRDASTDKAVRDAGNESEIVDFMNDLKSIFQI